MKEQIEGALQDIGGKLQDAVGAAVENPGLQAKGKARQAAAKVHQTYGEALDSLRETAVSNPIATLATVAGIGFLLGVLWARRD
jgi:uncharacterized protein YjbJ (UPF0337 family)